MINFCRFAWVDGADVLFVPRVSVALAPQSQEGDIRGKDGCASVHCQPRQT